MPNSSFCPLVCTSDISLVQFHEEGEIYAEDVPDWVKQSPHEFSTGQRLLTTWGQQLVDEEGSGDSLPMDKDIKGKKKAKMKGDLAERGLSLWTNQKARISALRKCYINNDKHC